jgi:hypothetical protein
MNHVSGYCLLLIRVLVHENNSVSNTDFCCHFAISAHKLSDKLSPVTLVAAIFGNGRVNRKFHANHANNAVLPGPLQACIA